MPTVAFAAPFFLDTTRRFIAAVAAVPGVRLAVVSQDPEERLGPELRARLAAHYRIDDGLDAGQIQRAVEIVGRHLGSPVDRLLGTLEELQVPLAVVREHLGIDGMDVEAARNFRDKDRMKAALSAAGLPCARHRKVADEDEAGRFVAEVGYPVVAKPPAGAGARNTFRIDGDDQLRDYLRLLPPSSARPALFEEFLAGEEHSFDSVCVDGRLVWHSINHYFPSPLEVLRTPWIQWCVLLPREVDTPRYRGIRDVARRSLEVLGMRTGLSHMEWFLRRDGSVAVSEVAARPPGAQFTTLLSYAHDTDFYRAWARLMVDGTFDPPSRPYAAGAAFLRGQGQGVVRKIHGLDQAQKELGAIVMEARLPKEGQSPTGSYEGEGWVVLRHPETRVVEEGLKRLVTLVRVELG